MKRVLFFLLALFCLSFSLTVRADVDYSIESYQGDLLIHEDNTATFKQVVVYQFDSSYNGQYVSLGKAGKTPPEFDITGMPDVIAYRNDVLVNPEVNLENLTDGYRLKIYNQGSSGDKVRVEVTWQLQNMLFLHQDVAELNWIPISDWEQSIGHVSFSVRTDKEVADSQIYVHRGYLNGKTSISKNAKDYQIEIDDVSGVLELRGYWDKALINLPSQSSKSAKQAIIKEENQIKRRSEQLTFLYFKLQPGLVLLVVPLSFIYFLLVRRRLLPSKNTARIYQAPQDLHPLLVAKSVYGSDLEDPKNTMVFDHMIQASLLELMDKGIVAISTDSKSLLLNSGKRLSELDQALVDFLFGGQEQVELDSLFDQYAVDESIFKQAGLHGSRLEKSVRQQGQYLERKMSSALSAIDRAVAHQLKSSGEELCFRHLNKSERKQLGRGRNAIALVCLIVIVMGVVALTQAWGAGLWFSFLLCMVCLVALGFILKMISDLEEVGTLTKSGTESYQAWQSYRNMFKDLGHFDKADLASLVIWNQVLVYATLFGEAKRVHRYLKLHQIQLDNPSLDSYVSHSLYLPVNRSLHNYQSYSSIASNASHFSVSSSGSSGGGFSGGGGGGGGGAF